VTGQRVRVSVYEPSRVFRECLEAVLAGAGLTVVGGHESAPRFLAGLSADRPDVAVADLGLGPGGGAQEMDPQELVREIREKHPLLALVVLATSSRPDPESCYREGAAAYVDGERGTSQELVRAVQAAASGIRLFPLSLASSGLNPEPAPQAAPITARLSLRERQVLSLIGAGADNLKIAAQLGISERTVKAHVTSLYRKSQVENRTQLAILAREIGLKPQVEMAAAPVLREEPNAPAGTGLQRAQE
jgi:DNA-binding NarL/FixJ family response regulator